MSKWLPIWFLMNLNMGKIIFIFFYFFLFFFFFLIYIFFFHFFFKSVEPSFEFSMQKMSDAPSRKSFEEYSEWLQSKKLTSTILPRLIAKKISRMISHLSTSQQISVLKNIVVVGGFVTLEFIQLVEKNFHLFVDHSVIPFHFNTHKIDPKNSKPV